MPSYSAIKRWMDSTEKARTAERLLALRRKLRSEITDRTDRHSVLVATWNLRDFDSNRLGHGPRLRESFYYIAEIVSAFDIVILQEVSRNLDGLEALMTILGAGWDYLATGANETRGGVEERMVFVYRLDKVQFRKIAGEMALPGGQAVMPRAGAAAGAASHPALPLRFVRMPFLTAFEAAGAKLNFCVLHLAYANGAGARAERETGELDALARFFRERPDREDTVLIGDFGVGAPSDAFAKLWSGKASRSPKR